MSVTSKSDLFGDSATSGDTSARTYAGPAPALPSTSSAVAQCDCAYAEFEIDTAQIDDFAAMFCAMCEMLHEHLRDFVLKPMIEARTPKGNKVFPLWVFGDSVAKMFYRRDFVKGKQTAALQPKKARHTDKKAHFIE